MRLLAISLLAFAISACTRADSAEHSAAVTAPTAVTAPAPAPAVAPVAPSTPETFTADEHHCGCGMSPSTCNGHCDGTTCGGEAPHLVAPANATWTTLHVAGMHCGGCARRIERALAKVDGVLGVKADFATSQVQVATASGTDVRKLVSPAIDNLGYQVQ